MLNVTHLVVVFVNWITVAQLPVQARVATADNQGNFYIIDNQNTLIKLDSLGIELYRYHRDAGTLTSIDATNPLKPLCYFASTSTLLSLDNTLTPASTIELKRSGFTQVTSVCRSSDEKIWLYDASDFTIKKLDYSGEIIRQGTDLLQQTGFAPDIHFMIEHDQKVYLCDSTHGILVADLYGNYEKTIPIKGLQQFQFLNNQLLYFNNEFMLFYDLRTHNTDSVSLSGVESFHQAVYSKNRLMTLGQNRLSLYRLEKP